MYSELEKIKKQNEILEQRNKHLERQNAMLMGQMNYVGNEEPTMPIASNTKLTARRESSKIGFPEDSPDAKQQYLQRVSSYSNFGDQTKAITQRQSSVLALKQGLQTQKGNLKTGQDFHPDSTHTSSKSYLPPSGNRKQTLKDDPRVMEASSAPLKLPAMQNTVSATGSIMHAT